ncbi:SRR1-like protein [Macrobrachium rosenbergii]|uniref:SRR1-like protein n=1 Tax=Macrobrachium rosenbergii TaxID=79674 RepID=UPI0034D49A30
MSTDGFIFVSKRRRAKAKGSRVAVDEPVLFQTSVEDTIEKILKAKDKLQCSCGFRDFEENLQKVESHLETQVENNCLVSSIVCYGLGLPSCGWIACYQTGLLLILRDYFKVQVEVYDPAFTEVDVEVLKKLCFTVIENNEEGKRKIKIPTIFYMPHCGKGLYNNLLWTNWDYECLSKCVIVGNSFSTINENIPERILRKYYKFILLSTGFFHEYPVKALVKEDNIFNDTSIHVVKNNLKKTDLTPDFWSVESEPEYESDAEFIRVK